MSNTIPNAFFFMFFTSCFLDFLLGGIGNAVRHEPPCASDKRKSKKHEVKNMKKKAFGIVLLV